jgi:hypothetical protein
LKQLCLANSQKKRRQKWQLRREIRRISVYDSVKSQAVLDFAIYTRGLKANLQWKRYGWGGGGNPDI